MMTTLPLPPTASPTMSTSVVADGVDGRLVDERLAPRSLRIGVGVPGDHGDAGLAGPGQRRRDQLRVVGRHGDHVEPLRDPAVDHLHLLFGAIDRRPIVDQVDARFAGRFAAPFFGGGEVADADQLGHHADAGLVAGSARSRATARECEQRDN